MRSTGRHLLAWIALAAAFGLLLWRWRGPEAAQQYAAGYLLELGLSADNAFVFFVLFERFRVGPAEQARVLRWGVLGAIALRTAFLLAGLGLLRRLPILLYAFGVFLVSSGIRLWLQGRRGPSAADPADGAVLRLCRRWLPLAAGPGGTRFFTTEGGRRVATPLFLVLILVEATDLVFALDSMPAVLAVTKNAFVAVSSNILAVIALRALYLAVTALLPRLRWLRSGLALLLIMIGVKMLASRWIELPTWAVLGAIGLVLAVCLAAGGPSAQKEGRERM